MSGFAPPPKLGGGRQTTLPPATAATSQIPTGSVGATVGMDKRNTPYQSWGKRLVGGTTSDLGTAIPPRSTMHPLDKLIQDLAASLARIDRIRRNLTQDPNIRKANRNYLGRLLSEAQDNIDHAHDRLAVIAKNPEIDAMPLADALEPLDLGLTAEIFAQSLAQAQEWMGEDRDLDPMPPWTEPRFPGSGDAA